ncbi:transcription termination factor NusA [PVC group bacterium (ex Bugula neritina AB1)]|nr:transcription termination factor NusA [PVC group bacterium (ex Bugula neritina AB1)]
MDNDFMMIINALEKDKGIDKYVLLQAIRSAMETVARKALDLSESSEVNVNIDEVTGRISFFIDQKEITTAKLGRIAAQTAKQVIMQKIKEAETDVMYESYKDKIGELVSGVIQRFERGAIILEVGRAEVILPRNQQVFRDNYRINDRLHVYLTDIKRLHSHLKMLASRAVPEMVQKLFEFEVPEIAEGSIEIKGIVREAGDRTKIAVYSHLPTIESVGACVGMRGSRVKSIVNELRGEKVDIVCWDENPEVFISNALNPAEILQLNLDHKNKSCKVIVPKDKFSLAIGKKGQNARLAAKLTDWDIHIEAEETTSSTYNIDKLFKDKEGEEGNAQEGSEVNSEKTPSVNPEESPNLNTEESSEENTESSIPEEVEEETSESSEWEEFVSLIEAAVTEEVGTVTKEELDFFSDSGIVTLEKLALFRIDDVENETNLDIKRIRYLIDFAKKQTGENEHESL